MSNIQVSILNRSTVLTDNQVQAVVPALQIQVHRDFAPPWGTDADLTFVPKSKKPDPKSWWVVILDNSDQAGALGYHDLTTTGLPLGKVFAATDKQYGSQWTVTASHELLEMLGDPEINLTVFVQNSNTAGRLYAYETADACEADSDAYQINGVLVSDFVYPAWFESSIKQAGPLDYRKLIKKPFELRPGGYISYFDVGTGSGWQQLHGRIAKQSYASRPHVGSRRERRRTPRDLWLLSTAKV